MPRIALTIGEPAGIGADLCVQLAQQNLPCQLSRMMRFLRQHILQLFISDDTEK